MLLKECCKGKKFVLNDKMTADCKLWWEKQKNYNETGLC
jgi:hypothetical protein